MKDMLNSMIVAFSMYSRIPTPKKEWTERSLKYAFVFFPLIGAIVGASVTALMLICGHFGLHGVFFASAAIAANVFITGGIHLDGFCDVMDAAGSMKDREEMLRIMKDPHTGAFAVIYVTALFAAQLGLYTQFFYNGAYLWAPVWIFTLSRVLTGLSVVVFPHARSGGLAAMFSDGASKKPVCAALICMAAAVCAALILMYMRSGAVLAAVSGALFLWHYYYSKKRFGGMTGDVAGFFLNVFETVLLLAAVILGVLI